MVYFFDRFFEKFDLKVFFKKIRDYKGVFSFFKGFLRNFRERKF